VLSFVAPGTPAQVVAGLAITFIAFIFFHKAKPYADKTYLGIAYLASLGLFLFFYFAYLLRTEVPISMRLFNGVIGVLTAAIVVVPVGLVAMRVLLEGVPLGEDEGADAPHDSSATPCQSEPSAEQLEKLVRCSITGEQKMET
jgi:hypothetical protein